MKTKQNATIGHILVAFFQKLEKLKLRQRLFLKCNQQLKRGQNVSMVIA